MVEMGIRVPLTRRAGKTRSLLIWLSYGIKGVAFFALVAFLYTAGARDGARNLRVVERALGADGDGREDEDSSSATGFIPIAPRRCDWREERNIPKHCKILENNPKPYDKSCKRKDYLLYKMHFQHLKRPGNYLDVAANEPIGLSNTYFYDRCLGWSGLCVEGNPRYFEKIHRLRSCALLPTCVGEYDGQTVDFILKGGSGGIDSTNKGAARWAASNVPVRKIKVRCTTIGKELQRYRAPKVIDYMSLDVEGHELHVLHGIDWKATKINVITIEVSPKSYAPIQEFMSSIGYKELTHLPDGKDTRIVFGGDALFLAPEVIFGKPE